MRIETELRDPLLALCFLSLRLRAGMLGRMIIETRGLDDALDVPEGEGGVIWVLRSVPVEELPLAVAEELTPKQYNALVLERGVLLLPLPARCFRLILKGAKIPWIVPPCPLVVRLGADAKTAAGDSDGCRMIVPPEKPLEATFCRL